MKALTLTQPWAQFMALGEKEFETRSWYTDYRGPLAIHAAKSWPKADQEWTMEGEWSTMIRERHGLDAFTDFARGSVIAIVDLVGVYPTENADMLSNPEVANKPYERIGGPGRVIVSHKEEALGNYAPGRWVWVTSNVMPLLPAAAEPARGHLGLWDWTPNGPTILDVWEAWIAR
jgi:hypothetical protein